MPTYEYTCSKGHHFELVQKMSHKPRARCPTCGTPATRNISAAGLVFKGSGFYITDYGKDGKGPKKADTGEKTESPKVDLSPKPAAEKPAPKADKADKPSKKAKSE
jgi:putative FmdB family regulatory protein